MFLLKLPLFIYRISTQKYPLTLHEVFVIGQYKDVSMSLSFANSCYSRHQAFTLTTFFQVIVEHPFDHLICSGYKRLIQLFDKLFDTAYNEFLCNQKHLFAQALVVDGRD